MGSVAKESVVAGAMSAAKPIVALGAVGALAALSYLASTRRGRRRTKVVITGGSGNLGTKLATHLLQSNEFEVVLIEREWPALSSSPRLPVRVCP